MERTWAFLASGSLMYACPHYPWLVVAFCWRDSGFKWAVTKMGGKIILFFPANRTPPLHGGKQFVLCCWTFKKQPVRYTRVLGHEAINFFQTVVITRWLPYPPPGYWTAVNTAVLQSFLRSYHSLLAHTRHGIVLISQWLAHNFLNGQNDKVEASCVLHVCQSFIFYSS